MMQFSHQITEKKTNRGNKLKHFDVRLNLYWLKLNKMPVIIVHVMVFFDDGFESVKTEMDYLIW